MSGAVKRFLRAGALCGVSLFALCGALNVSAHEAYVLNRDYFWRELARPASFHAFDALRAAGNIAATLEITAGVLAALLLNAWFRRTKTGAAFHRGLEHFAHFGPLFVRLAIAASFIFGAASGSFLGPELPLAALPAAAAMRAALFLSGILIGLGLFTEAAAALAAVLFTVGFVVFGTYLLTYLNYLGEIIALILFGSRRLSFDRLLFGPLGRFARLKKYETTLVRVCYGAALVFAAITVKLLHPALTVTVVNDWHLTQFHFLFPRDPLLVALGAGLSEFAIGLFIALGFELRFTVLVSLIYITLSLFYFRELVWPHLMLYGISLNLLVEPEILTLDGFFSHSHTRPAGASSQT